MPMIQKIRMAAVVKLEVEPTWLALPPAERRRIVGGLLPILKKYSDVEVQWFDSDALGSGYAGFTTHRFVDLARYHFLWEELGDIDLDADFLLGAVYYRLLIKQEPLSPSMAAEIVDARWTGPRG